MRWCTCSQVAYTFSGCVHVLRLHTCSQVAYMFSGCVHVLRLHTRSQVAYMFSGCIHVLRLHTCSLPLPYPFKQALSILRHLFMLILEFGVHNLSDEINIGKGGRPSFVHLTEGSSTAKYLIRAQFQTFVCFITSRQIPLLQRHCILASESAIVFINIYIHPIGRM